ncbi:hypothetical protein T439DRAFT_345989 [Meredithblackwellia eburnea MCA 4105]
MDQELHELEKTEWTETAEDLAASTANELVGCVAKRDPLIMLLHRESLAKAGMLGLVRVHCHDSLRLSALGHVTQIFRRSRRLIIQLLLLSGASPDLRGATQVTARERAAKLEDKEAVRLFEEWERNNVQSEAWKHAMYTIQQPVQKDLETWLRENRYDGLYDNEELSRRMYPATTEEFPALPSQQFQEGVQDRTPLSPSPPEQMLDICALRLFPSLGLRQGDSLSPHLVEKPCIAISSLPPDSMAEQQIVRRLREMLLTSFPSRHLKVISLHRVKTTRQQIAAVYLSSQVTRERKVRLVRELDECSPFKGGRVRVALWEYDEVEFKGRDHPGSALKGVSTCAGVNQLPKAAGLLVSSLQILPLQTPLLPLSVTAPKLVPLLLPRTERVVFLSGPLDRLMVHACMVGKDVSCLGPSFNLLVLARDETRVASDHKLQPFVSGEPKSPDPANRVYPHPHLSGGNSCVKCDFQDRDIVSGLLASGYGKTTKIYICGSARQGKRGSGLVLVLGLRRRRIGANARSGAKWPEGYLLPLILTTYLRNILLHYPLLYPSWEDLFSSSTNGPGWDLSTYALSGLLC